MKDTLTGKRIAILATDGVERVEYEQPCRALLAADATVDLVSPKPDKVQAQDSDLNPAAEFEVDRCLDQALAEDYDALVLPGGTINPDRLRIDEDAMRFVRAMVAAGKPVAAICHGPWSLVETGVVAGRRLTSWPSLRTDIERAGGQWIDEEVVIDGPFVTSRRPGDLPAFCAAMVEHFATHG
ncbi:MAG TPA: type 1 glutamine amidotransferase domain-containing protein [Sporichthyaceae bacterium]|jgi:protease I